MKTRENEQRLNVPGPSLHLAANTRKILEFVDGALSPPDTLSIEQHLQRCPECREFHEKARRLDSALERGLKPPMLSASFAARLQERIAAEDSPQSQAAFLEQKQRLQAEFEQQSVRLRKQFFALPNLLDALSYSVGILVGCYVLFAGTGWLSGKLSESWPSLEQHRMLLFSGSIALVSILVAWSFAIRRQTPLIREEA